MATGHRMRQIQRRSLKKFLEWAVVRTKLPAAYAPPTVPEIKAEKKLVMLLQISRLLH